MTSGNPMVDNQDRENSLTDMEQREIDIAYELKKLYTDRKRTQEVLEETQQDLDKIDAEIEELENEKDNLCETNEIEE
jgi:peptidoglycan hydrolase CwlO-like protein